MKRALHDTPLWIRRPLFSDRTMSTSPRPSTRFLGCVIFGLAAVLAPLPLHAHWWNSLGDRSAATAYAVPLPPITLDRTTRYAIVSPSATSTIIASTE